MKNGEVMLPVQYQPGNLRIRAGYDYHEYNVNNRVAIVSTQLNAQDTVSVGVSGPLTASSGASVVRFVGHLLWED
jgi:hypothetical protein